MIGNGFDLYHGLPTKYKNFLHTMEYIINNKDKNLDKFPIGIIFYSISLKKTDTFIEKSYKKYKDIYNNINFEKQDYNKIIRSSNNMWLKYFINSFNKDLGWIDFEKEIAFVINNFESFLVDASVSYNNAKVLKNFDYFFELINVRPMYFSSDNIRIFDKYIDNSPYNSNDYKPDREKISDELFNSLKELMLLLKLYLKYFVEKPLKLANKKEIVNKNIAFEKANYVVNFNYTDTYEELYQYDKNNIFHIHGISSNKIVLGINPDNNDELFDYQGANTTFIKFKKYYQRIVNKTDNKYRSFICNLKEKNYDGYLNVIVCGHSLDRTDEDVIKELFSMADKLIITYHDESAIGQYITNLISIYGKKEFDILRNRTSLDFTSYDELPNCFPDYC